MVKAGFINEVVMFLDMLDSMFFNWISCQNFKIESYHKKIKFWFLIIKKKKKYDDTGRISQEIMGKALQK